MLYTELMSTISVAPVREKAEERGITSASAFAEATGLHYPSAWKWWNDRVTQIHTDTLARIADFLECDPGELIVRKEDT